MIPNDDDWKIHHFDPFWKFPIETLLDPESYGLDRWNMLEPQGLNGTIFGRRGRWLWRDLGPLRATEPSAGGEAGGAAVGSSWSRMLDECQPMIQKECRVSQTG